MDSFNWSLPALTWVFYKNAYPQVQKLEGELILFLSCSTDTTVSDEIHIQAHEYLEGQYIPVSISATSIELTLCDSDTHNVLDNWKSEYDLVNIERYSLVEPLVNWTIYESPHVLQKITGVRNQDRLSIAVTSILLQKYLCGAELPKFANFVTK